MPVLILAAEIFAHSDSAECSKGTLDRRVSRASEPSRCAANSGGPGTPNPFAWATPTPMWRLSSSLPTSIDAVHRSEVTRRHTSRCDIKPVPSGSNRLEKMGNVVIKGTSLTLWSNRRSAVPTISTLALRAHCQVTNVMAPLRNDAAAQVPLPVQTPLWHIRSNHRPKPGGAACRHARS